MTPPQKFYLEKLPDGSLTSVTPFNKLMEALGKLKAGRWVITIEKYFPKRSLGQNSFYFANFIPSQIDCFKEFWGEEYSKEQVHEFNKVNFWGEEKLVEETGEVVKIPESSTKQTTVTWEIKLEKARQWHRQSFNWEIGYPEQQEEMEF